MPYDQYNPLAEYQAQNRALMAQIAAQLQGNMQLMGSNVPLANTTYISPQMFSAPTLFGQFTNIVGSLMGDEAGAMTQLGGQLATSPALRPYLGPLPGLVSSMMGSMPIGSSTDPGAFMYSQLQGRLGRNIPQPVQLPYDFSSKAGIDLYNEQVAQLSQFLNPQSPFGSASAAPRPPASAAPRPPAAAAQPPVAAGIVPYSSTSSNTNGVLNFEERGTVLPAPLPMLSESQRERVLDNSDNFTGIRRNMLRYALRNQNVTFQDFNSRFEGSDADRDRVKARFQVYEAQRAREVGPDNKGIPYESLDILMAGDFLSPEGDDTPVSKNVDATLARIRLDAYAARLPELASKDPASAKEEDFPMPDLVGRRAAYSENVQSALGALTPGLREQLVRKADAAGVTKSALQAALADTALPSVTFEQRNKEDEQVSRIFDDLVKELAQGDRTPVELPLSTVRDRLLPTLSGADSALQGRMARTVTALQSERIAALSDADSQQLAAEAAKQAQAQIEARAVARPAPEAPTSAATPAAPTSAATPAAPTSAAMPMLQQFNEALGKADSGYGYGVQLGNIQTLSQSDRFRDVFSMFSAATGQSTAMTDPQMQELVRLSRQATPEAAQQAQNLLQSNPELKSRADRLINTANNAASMANLAMNISTMIPPGMLGGAEAGALEGLSDIFMGLTGINRNPAQFTSAAVQSMSMLGALGTETIVEPDGRRVFAAERVAAGLTANLENVSSPFSATRSLGVGRAGTLMSELAKSGILTSGGVDVFGSIKPEDVRKMEQAMAQQLEGFSEVARAGRRIGMQVNEILPAMQSLYGGTFAEALSNQAGRVRAEMRADVAGTSALESRENERRRAAGGQDMTSDERRVFLESEAQRRAGVTMMQQVEKAVQIGRFAGLDARGSMAVMQTASQLGMDMGLGGEAGIAMGMSAMSRVSTSRAMGMPMTIDQSLALSRDIMAKGAENPSVQAFASLSLAVGTGVLKQEQVSDLMNAFREGKDIDPGEVNRRISATGANLSAFTGREAVARGMTMAANDINRFYSANENVSVTGAVKAAFREQGIDAEALAQKMVSGQGEEIAKAFGFVDERGMAQTERLQGMDFTQFAAQFNKIGDQESRVALLDKLQAAGTITSEERAQLLSNLGERMDRFGLASDKGSMRTARIRQAEEAERARLGGSTMVELRAAAVVENQALINKAISPTNNMQQGLTEGLASTRRAKVERKMKESPGMTQAQAEGAVDAEGFTITELLSSATVLTEPAMKASLEASLKSVDEELSKAEKSGNVARVEQLKLQRKDLQAMQDISLTTSPEERAQKIERLRQEQERDIYDKERAKRESMTPEEKKTAEVGEAALSSRDTLLRIEKLLQGDLAENTRIAARSVQALEGRVA